MRPRRFQPTLFLALTGCILASTASARCLSVAGGVGVAGSTTTVAVVLDNATDVASVGLTLNYDPSILTPISVTNGTGTLGSGFQYQSDAKDGCLRLVLTREDALASGQGTLATLAFVVNPGTPAGQACDLVVATCELSGAYGSNLSWSGSVATSNGQFNAVASMQADSNGNGLPDWWEIQNFGAITNIAASADSDGDGSSNQAEYLAGTDPHNPAECLRITGCLTPSTTNASSGFILRWSSVADKFYAVARSTNLATGFSPWLTHVPATPPENVATDATWDANGAQFYRINLNP